MYRISWPLIVAFNAERCARRSTDEQIQVQCREVLSAMSEAASGGKSAERERRLPISVRYASATRSHGTWSLRIFGDSMIDDARHRETFGCELKPGTTSSATPCG